MPRRSGTFGRRTVDGVTDPRWPRSCSRRASSARGRAAVLREGSVLTEAGRYAARPPASAGARRREPYAGRARRRGARPGLLVPGFLAGDGTLR